MGGGGGGGQSATKSVFTYLYPNSRKADKEKENGEALSCCKVHMDRQRLCSSPG